MAKQINELMEEGNKIAEEIAVMEENLPSPEEIANRPRWQKSATPKQTLDLYVKWIASICVLAVMSMRGIEGLQLYDLTISVVGIILWLWVSIIWKDRALIILNSFGLLLLVRNLITTLNGMY